MATDPHPRTPLPVIRLAAGGQTSQQVTGRVQLRIGGEPVTVEVTVPEGPTPLGELLPVFQGLTNAVVELAVVRAGEEGRTVSCRAGCGACCRQLVPVSESEARGLARLVDALPEPRRAAVRERFADAVRRCAEAGMTERLTRAYQGGGESARELGLEYFRVGVPCPFLEEESCSIHPDRPLACREYLVTSPAANCASPSAESIAMLPLAGRPSLAVMAADRSATAGGFVPLVLALEWAAAHPAAPPPRPGPDVVRDVFARLAGQPTG
jgi:Fe-S-cluster containining protein